MRKLDLTMADFVNGDTLVVTRKGKPDGGLSGVFDVLAGRGVSNRSSDNQSDTAVSKSHHISRPFSGNLLDLGCGPLYQGF